MIKTAILSFGMSGRVFHAPFITMHKGFELKGILERTKQESLLFYPNIHIYRSLEEVLNDDEIDLVIVNTPTNTHFDFVKKALRYGREDHSHPVSRPKSDQMYRTLQQCGLQSALDALEYPALISIAELVPAYWRCRSQTIDWCGPPLWRCHGHSRAENFPHRCHHLSL